MIDRGDRRNDFQIGELTPTESNEKIQMGMAEAAQRPKEIDEDPRGIRSESFRLACSAIASATAMSTLFGRRIFRATSLPSSLSFSQRDPS